MTELCFLYISFICNLDKTIYPFHLCYTIKGLLQHINEVFLFAYLRLFFVLSMQGVAKV